ncbi:glucose-6-phosphate isomerase [Thioalkalivibrio sp. XN8]|uniref:glucose-6-phosphate isomerase n=1 Tax=Thioalkalivibrio sp. XN8 TaxID=2712863 RepID=UPI0013EAADF6|nr:glucose-6-phosphate isomerase [Thioalkalivibrio sp. XN8]NGP52263.1 glucose-6-phosphate isomerase [Thioalkalivibrio sp. XN8]
MGSKKTVWPKGLKSWGALKDHCRQDLKKRHLRDLFRRDPERFTRFSVEAEGLLLDFSRNLLTRKTLKLLNRLARETGVEVMRERMFAGEHINNSEDRAVLHVALRSDRDDPYFDGDFDATAAVHEVLDRMEAFVHAVHSGQYAGHGTGRHLTDVVNIGIGGSDLGIEMAVGALANYRAPGMRVHCVSNIDGVGLGDVLAKIDPATTLFVICSKTFTTLETLTNARAAREWFVQRYGAEAVRTHFVGVSTNHEAMDEFGISPANRFGFWDFVGGRYSLWSAVGLSIALGIGMDNFRALLAGGRAMDRHFRDAPLDANLPVLMGLLSAWNTNFLGCNSLAVLPYDSRLARFPAYLQQLHMESNGKARQRDGAKVTVDTAPVLWGEPGSNAQHSFFQLLHQGTQQVAIDFLAPVQASGPSQEQHDLALANMLAQARALSDGDCPQDRSWGQSPGNRPSTTLLFQKLDPETLGKLVALYEHKVFVESIIWGLNAFDQPGVELGKRLAREMTDAVAEPDGFQGGDASTRGMLDAIARWR